MSFSFLEKHNEGVEALSYAQILSFPLSSASLLDIFAKVKKLATHWKVPNTPLDDKFVSNHLAQVESLEDFFCYFAWALKSLKPKKSTTKWEWLDHLRLDHTS